MKTYLAAIGLCLSCTPTAAWAQTTEAPPPPDMSGDRVTIGAGVGSLPDYEGADDNRLYPVGIAIGQVSGISFWTRGTQLYVDLVPDSGGVGTSFEAGPVAGIRLNRTGDIHTPQVAALGKLNTAYEVGGFAGISRTGVVTSDYDTLTARVAVTTDVGNAHKSYTISPQISYFTPLSRYNLVGISASADYVGKGYGSYYYDVTPAGSAASGLRPYHVSGSGFQSYSLGIYGLQSITGDLTHGLGIGGGIGYTRILGKYADSPIVADVGNRDQWIAGLGLAYTF
ncbi:MipA/OmpV family protein [Stakelama marina]|uniref:MipA/OmpV family protein n=1 Tax=Stakelama marina TaxID=2826939 RepID=A0A8T4ILN1_9SPHN|nr:MipA/OmpV family protein [Stakelama marina]MBR0553066.1 MipA/OmpV family protein [Stakelama marina]